MNSTAWLLGTVCAVTVAAGSCGCGSPSGKSWGAGNSSATVVRNGTNLTYALQHITRDGLVCFVIVGNGCSGGSSAGGEGNHQGQLFVNDGRKIAWSCTTTDGKNGNAVVDGREFDLQNGAMFLVSTRDSPTKIEQLKIEGKHLQSCSDSRKFVELAMVDPKLEVFLKTCGDSGPAIAIQAEEPDAPKGEAVVDPALREARDQFDAIVADLLAGQFDDDPSLSPVARKLKGYSSCSIKSQKISKDGNADFRGVLIGPAGHARFDTILVKQVSGKWAIGTFSGPNME